MAPAARFRQLNNQSGPTAFSNASGVIVKAAKVHDPTWSRWWPSGGSPRCAPEQEHRHDRVRDALPEGTGPSTCPVSYGNLRPANLFNTYFYFLRRLTPRQRQRRQLVDINSEDGNAAYQMFGFLIRCRRRTPVLRVLGAGRAGARLCPLPTPRSDQWTLELVDHRRGLRGQVLLAPAVRLGSSPTTTSSGGTRSGTTTSGNRGSVQVLDGGVEVARVELDDPGGISIRSLRRTCRRSGRSAWRSSIFEVAATARKPRHRRPGRTS